jgi:hypothetical protein
VTWEELEALVYGRFPKPKTHRFGTLAYYVEPGVCCTQDPDGRLFVQYYFGGGPVRDQGTEDYHRALQPVAELFKQEHVPYRWAGFEDWPGGPWMTSLPHLMVLGSDADDRQVSVCKPVQLMLEL